MPLTLKVAARLAFYSTAKNFGRVVLHVRNQTDQFPPSGTTTSGSVTTAASYVATLSDAEKPALILTTKKAKEQGNNSQRLIIQFTGPALTDSERASLSSDGFLTITLSYNTSVTDSTKPGTTTITNTLVPVQLDVPIDYIDDPD